MESGDGRELLALARSLPDDDYLLLQLAALLYEPLSTAFLCRSFIGLRHFLSDEQRLRTEEVRGIIERLRRQGLLTPENRCPPVLAELLLRAGAEEKRFARLLAFVEQSVPMEYRHGRWQLRCWRALRRFRIGICSRNSDLVEETLALLHEPACRHFFAGMPPTVQILTCAFDPPWFAALPAHLRFLLLDHLIHSGIAHLLPIPAVQAYLQQDADRQPGAAEQLPFLRLLATWYLVRGETAALARLLDTHEGFFTGSGLRAALALQQGDVERAGALFRQDLDFLAGLLGEKTPVFSGLPGIFSVLVLLRTGDEAAPAAARRSLARMQERCGGEMAEMLPLRSLEAYAAHLQGERPDLLPLGSALTHEEHPIALLLALLVFYWLGVEIAPGFIDRLEGVQRRAEEGGFTWIAREAAALGAALKKGPVAVAAALEDADRPVLSRLFEPAQDWQQSLDELIAAVHAVRRTDSDRRLCWFVDYADSTLSLAPREQRRNARGQWSAGRSLALSRLAGTDQPYFTPQDQRLRAALVRVTEGAGTSGNRYAFDLERALPALIGHPLVFLRQFPKTPVEIVAAEPELMVERRGDFLFLYFPHPLGTEPVCVWPESATRFRVLRIREEHRRVAAITGTRGLRVPLSASAELLATIGRLASFMTVHSAIDMPGTGESLESVPGDATPHIHIIPLGEGFRVELFVRPFTMQGPYIKPGEGAANLIAEIEGRRLRARRDLDLEEARAREVEESCPMLDLATDMEMERRHEWHLLEPEDCLQVLLELDAIRDRVVLEWPEGKKLSIRRQVGTSQLNLNIRGLHQNWFALSGQVRIDEAQVVELCYLLDRARQSPGRFIPLGEGQFLALTQEFRNRLDELLYYGSMEGTGKEIRVHALAAMALDELGRRADTTAEPSWHRRQEEIGAVWQLSPAVPATLKAELRDYQREGFVWLSRMATLGLGACLADDMGLGKTLQALALILSRAKDGPTLVVAPTSVCMNWQAEIRRFAPTLCLRQPAELRQDPEREPAAFEVFVCSYTLLQQEEKALAAIVWQTIVLDEAQAIKNAATKRSQAAMRLKAAFRLITTGTPIENHLGELWNLFAFINPGLLGSLKQFNRRFGVPIEKHRDKGARKMLKKLIRPFILRRIKAEVLDELPPRTEVSLRVELSRDERSFYEALRRQALENIEGDRGKNERQIRILTEIMRLRRACCNARLIDPGMEIASSKEQVFSDLVDELIGAGHKALVFSQFTGHLRLLCRHLDARRIGYCYLDGATATAQRRRQVEAFQSGGAPLFLISLKAGGLGLNLTAADYVIHMDPWWNPAVEDQAADRAHRIGQKRPVTVYRLVSADTIEEKIVRLHHAKRDLADSLLEGTDVSARIGAEELLELIRSG